jgi:pimeloyl-ACP methyl ester carboxylesterase
LGQERFANNGGVWIHYEIEGTGPAVLMRTGAGGDCRIWKDAGYVAGLKGYRTILMDQRGRGKSDRTTSIESHSYDNHVSDIETVLDDAGVESAAYMGYSAAATMGIAFAAAHPNRLKALVGMGSLPFYNFSELPKLANPEDEIEKIVAVGGVRREYEEASAEEGGRFPESIEQNVLGGDPRMRALDFVAGRVVKPWRGPLNVYPNLRFPVLMISGEKEDPERITEKAIAKIPKGQLVRLPGAGHLSSFYRSDLTLPYILPFLSKNLEAPSGS